MDIAPADVAPAGGTIAAFRLPLELADRIVREVFSVSLTLASARSLMDGSASTRLDQAVDELDDLVRMLRRAALDATPPDRPPARPDLRSVNDSTSAAASDLGLLDQAASALRHVDGQLSRLWVEAVADTGHAGARDRITDATRFVRLARVSLTAPALS